VVISGVDEGGVGDQPPVETVLILARRKAQAVAARLQRSSGALVIGCDSQLEVEGRGEGKPVSAAAAAELWRRMRSHSGLLHTGHCVIDCASGAEVAATDTTVVHFGDPTEREIDAYVATGEPLGVAGAFTMEGLGAPWVDSIEGNCGTVSGLSVPVLRRLLGRLGVEITDLWRIGPDGADIATAGFRARVEAVVAGLAPGEVVSYGDVAAEAGRPGAARAVGSILASPDIGPEVPWWRVVTVGGRLVPGHEQEHARRLAAEGVTVANGRVSRRRTSGR
jgi:septum formation protein